MPNGAGWRLLPTLLPVAAILLMQSLALSPAHADHIDGDFDHWFSIEGTVWLDENLDGTRQPSEPALPWATVALWRGGRPNSEPLRYSNPVGQYYFSWQVDKRHEEHRYLELLALYERPGATNVREYRGSDIAYSHWGCAYLYVRPGELKRTVDIRVVTNDAAGGVRDTPPQDWPVAGGRFFSDAASPKGCNTGFSVTDADEIPFWDTWQRLGVENVGRPISHRFVWRGLVTQAFQNAIMQWQPDKGVSFVNMFDELHEAGINQLPGHRWVKLPKRLNTSLFDAGKSREERQSDRLALLDEDPAIKERYYVSENPLLHFGLPTSRVEDFGSASVIRTEKAVFVHLKEDVPSAWAGDVVIVKGGELAKELNWFRDDAEASFIPQPAALVPPPADAAIQDFFTVSGTVWVDENVDGIRQLSEPALPEALVEITGRAVDDSVKTTTDERGHYTHVALKTDNVYPLRGAFIGSVYYTKPGAETITRSSRTFSHFGCAILHLSPDDEGTEVALDIRIVDQNHLITGEFWWLLVPPVEGWPLVDGRFFRKPATNCDIGYSVTNAGGIQFWDAWQELGLENVGYPISNRFIWEGTVTQAFQKAVLQWRPGEGFSFMNIFEKLHEIGWDRLQDSRWIDLPKRMDTSSFDARKSQEEIQRDRLALLDVSPAIKKRYFAADNPLRQYGLPTSRVEDFGNALMIRTEKVVFQEWKHDVAWAKAGEVTIVNGGSIAAKYSRSYPSAKAGFKMTRWFFPRDVLEPQPPGDYRVVTRVFCDEWLGGFEEDFCW